FSDITARKRRERNLGFLADLQKVFTPLTSAADHMRAASQRIVEHLGLSNCVMAEIDEAAQTASVLHDYPAPGRASLVGVYRIDDFLDPAERRELAAGRTLVIADVRSDGRTAQRQDRFAALGVRAMVKTSYAVDGHLKFVLGALRNEPHAWAPEDVELLTELVARLCVRGERARAEARLVESEERMRLAAEAARFGMYDRDLQGAYFHVSAQIKQILGYPPDAQLDHHQVMLHIHPDDCAAGLAAYQRAGEPGGDGRIEVEQRVVRRDGVVRWVATVGQLLFKSGMPHRSLGFWVDISDRKEAEAVLRRRDEELRAAAEVALASKYKSEFLANMSHELRTPLNSLLILSRLLADNTDKNLTPQQVEFAETMHHSGSDLLRLINEILDLSRIEAGRVEVYVEAIALAKLGEKIERDFRHVAQSRQLDFSVSLEPQLPAVIRSDANRLEQVLKNLLANSFKFTERGSVKLSMHRAASGWSQPHASLDRADGVVAFTVSDSGIGIAPDQQQLIFEAFAQADGTTSRKYGGTGLGLSISRELAGLLGGAITLTSEAGAGSSFTLYLPYTYAYSCTVTGAASLPLTEPAGRPVTPHAPPITGQSAALDDRQAVRPGDDVLLIVEYDPVFAGLLRDIAHRHAFKVLIANTAAAALQLARAYQPMAITLSVTLPDLDGWTLLRRVNDDLGLRHMPVHIVSGEDERPRGLRQGAASYLQKPASEAALGELFERIRASKGRAGARLLVVEDDPVMQRQIVQALGLSADERTTTVAGADVLTTLVASAEQGLTELRAQRYDCVVLDLRLPGMSGYEFLEAVRDELRIDDLPIVVYTGMDLSTQQRARLRQLAESVLVKDARSLDRLLDQTSLYLHRRVQTMPAAARATLERLHLDSGRLAGAKVLVVDDDMRNVFALFAILEGVGIEAEHAGNGKQCLARLAANADFAAVLMDIMMPEMGGYETMRRIREMPGLGALPVIALTAKAMPGDRETCIEAGATDYLTKPVGPEPLLAMLRYWIE
ncbi:MAG: response regulator, partial [Microbacteriaceae bacterium]|nr:response regulator [Burkholderiaceae bacterium]